MGFPMGKPPAEVLQKSIAPALMQSVTKVKHEEKPEEVMGRGEGGKGGRGARNDGKIGDLAKTGGFFWGFLG